MTARRSPFAILTQITLDGLVGPRFPQLGLRGRLVEKIGSAHMAELEFLV